MIKTSADTSEVPVSATVESGTAFAAKRFVPLASSAGVAAIVTFAMAALAICIMLNGECSRPPREYGIHSHLIEWMGCGGHYIWQSKGYFTLLGACALFVIAAPFMRDQLLRQYNSYGGRYLVALIAIAAFLFKSFQNPAGIAFGFVCLPVLYFFFKKGRGIPKIFYSAALTFFVALMVVPGLIVVPDLTASTAGKFLEIQTHYSDVVGPGALLAAGKPLFREVDPFYGLIQPILIAFVSSKSGTFSFGTYVEMVRSFQAIFIITAAFLFYKLSGRAKVASLFAIAFFAPLIQLNQMNEYFPNQTAWRLLGFPIAIVTMLSCRSLSRQALAFTLGAVSCFVIFFNLETGLCITAGFLAFLYMRNPESGFAKLLGLLKTAAIFVGGLLTAATVGYAAAWLMLGYAPDLNAYVKLVQNKQLLVQSGYLGGGRLEFQPIPFLMVVHSLYTILRIALDTRFPGGVRNSLRVATATMCLLWFTYFVNRPAPGDQYLIGCYFLYAFLVIDLIRAAIVGVNRKSRIIEPAVVTLAVLSLLIVPRISQQLKNAGITAKTTALELLHGPAQKPATIVSGIYLPSAMALELTEKANYVKASSQSGPVYYLTASSFMIPCLSGVQTAAPVIDLFSCLAFESDTDRLVELLEKRDVPTVLVDSSKTELVGYKSWVDCFVDLRHRLSRYYRHTSTRDGWEIWTKASAEEKP
ncbi:MAG: hypothetical protein EKK48_00345 [Candidatus Melainabacteria bacterium]|nr:MAG: hypothetical protein EKK48_00345 [Candidatus Melainabacteria bacterium]